MRHSVRFRHPGGPKCLRCGQWLVWAECLIEECPASYTDDEVFHLTALGIPKEDL